MLDFSDLEFKEHKVRCDHWRAELYFPNGWGVSVLQVTRPNVCIVVYEMAVLRHGLIDGGNPIIPDGVSGDLNIDGVDHMMALIQKLPRKEGWS